MFEDLTEAVQASGSDKTETNAVFLIMLELGSHYAPIGCIWFTVFKFVVTTLSTHLSAFGTQLHTHNVSAYIY